MTLREWLDKHRDSMIDTTMYGLISCDELARGCQSAIMDQSVRLYDYPSGLQEVVIEYRGILEHWQERRPVRKDPSYIPSPSRW